ncbi:hypothetical protein BBJ28_00007255 [Nothophytophthora sp. Chile5]|nr:hypothetical protein BBJ28_00007255 [Nothophytophthora sp. Chile5]
MKLSFVVSFLVLAMAAVTATANVDDSGSADGSGLQLEPAVDSASDLADASTAESASDETPETPETPEPLPPSPSIQPVVNGVKMFGQCGGLFYSGSSTCADPAAYCQELNKYNSICSPKLNQ